MVRFNEIGQRLSNSDSEALADETIQAILAAHFEISRFPTGHPVKISIDYQGKVSISGSCKHKGSFDRLPVNFDTVTGAFNLDHCGLSSLEGCPNSVGASFACRRNNITSLQGGPAIVKGHYICSDNYLRSLGGCPAEVGGDFVIQWHHELPLLRLLMYRQDQIVLKPRDGSPQYMLEQYGGVGVSRANILACQKAMIDAGFEGNASW